MCIQLVFLRKRSNAFIWAQRASDEISKNGQVFDLELIIVRQKEWEFHNEPNKKNLMWVMCQTQGDSMSALFTLHRKYSVRSRYIARERKKSNFQQFKLFYLLHGEEKPNE